MTAPTAAEIHQLWGGELLRIPPNVIDSRVLPAAREFLTTVGLPTKKAQGISCTDVPVLAGGYLTVAATRNRDLFGVELDGGRVDRISHYPDEPVQFVNSSLPLFVFSLGLYLRDVWEFLTANPTEDPEPRIEATDWGSAAPRVLVLGSAVTHREVCLPSTLPQPVAPDVSTNDRANE